LFLDGKEDVNGVSLFDDETILGNLDLICGRMKQLLEIIGTLRQFSKLAKDSSGLPRPRLEDIPTGQPLHEQQDEEHLAGGTNEYVKKSLNVISRVVLLWQPYFLFCNLATPCNLCIGVKLKKRSVEH